MDPKRLVLFIVLSFSILMLWEAWQRDQMPQQVPAAATAPVTTPAGTDVPAAPSPAAAAGPDAPQAVGTALPRGERVRVRTDLLQVEIDTLGGDLRRVELLAHRDSEHKDKNLLLLDDSAPPAIYVAQTGLIGNDLPNHKTQYTAQAGEFSLAPGQDVLQVRLQWNDGKGVRVDKIYTFRRGSYLAEVAYEIHNGGSLPLEPSAYYQIVHDSQSSQGSAMMPTYTGAAYFTEDGKYKKVSFEDMEKGNLSKSANNGWIGLVQHYYVGAWIPDAGVTREFYTRALSPTTYAMGAVSPLGSVASGATLTSHARFYAGPQEQAHLKSVAPGLEYTVDYGWLTIIAAPLFWVLSSIQKLVHNWGVAIILLTVLIKLAFYPLSAASYRSMAQMRELAPRLQRMKEQYGDDRQKMHQAMMELYKTEKINPMGGCLPILVQIPVFIALYWVLLGSVEMRHAPFALWIDDLSATDPYYVLPVLMGITMIIQTRLNPTPPDPIQARIMTIMPVVFSIFFFWFPAGLVLYWLINNVLSIAQQWRINHVIANSKKGHVKP